MIPSRHALGALLNEQGRHTEAEEVFREDLRLWPNNAWSLFGLKLALENQGKDASTVAAAFAVAAARADVPMHAPCFCARQTLASTHPT